MAHAAELPTATCSQASAALTWQGVAVDGSAAGSWPQPSAPPLLAPQHHRLLSADLMAHAAPPLPTLSCSQGPATASGSGSALDRGAPAPSSPTPP